MAYLRIEYFSNALHRTAEFEMMIPNDLRADIPWEAAETRPRRMKTLFLLHGYTGKAGNWVPPGVAEKYNFAIVMPTAENSFYLDGEATGRKYQTLVGEELVDYVRSTFGLAQGPDDTYIAGLSMGGFGALHTGLAYPDRFGKIAALSSALIIHELKVMQPGSGNGVANYEYYRECFGDLSTAAERDGAFPAAGKRQQSRDPDPEAESRRRKDPGYLYGLRHRRFPDRKQPYHAPLPRKRGHSP